jgi:plastocyanin
MLAKLTIPLTIALACTVLAAQAWAATSRTVGLRDNYLVLTSLTAGHGSVTFTATNHGLHTHTFNIKRVSTGAVLFQSRLISPGGDHVSVTRTLAAGKYRLYCRIHAGMYKIFTVT